MNEELIPLMTLWFSVSMVTVTA